MTKDFSKYQKIIDLFRGEVTAPDFEVRFATKTEKIPKTERFLLKMELKRLATDCTRLIDLRGHVDGECRSHEHEGRTHFLDDLAIQVFEENLKQYGKYTFGVYDAVINTENNFRVMYEKEKLNLKTETSAPKEPKVFEKTQYPAELITFSNYVDRVEERMNFAISIEVFQDESIKSTVTSTDISVKGCRFRVPKDVVLTVGEEIDIRFVGLEDEFVFGDDGLFKYKVKNIQLSNSSWLVGCQRKNTNNEDDAFQVFLSGFIQGNKRRYKINLDNTIGALESRTFEHFVIPEINELPVFVEQTKQGFIPRFALTGKNNKVIFNYWLNENKESTLDFLLSNKRLIALLDKNTPIKSIVVYSFIHMSQGKSYFYNADVTQLSKDKAFMKQFLGFCANKQSFRVFEISINKADTQLVLSPYTVSNTLQLKDSYLNAPPPKETQRIVNKITHIVSVTDISTDFILPFYQQLEFDGIDVSKLKLFGNKRHKHLLKVDEVGINYKNQRQEARFKYVTPAIIKVEDIELSGNSADFSMSGLKLNLNKSAVLMKGDVISIEFPELQKITKDFDLSALPYEVISITPDKTVINCRVFIEQHQHIGRAFFKLLIDKNRDKLTPDEYTMMTPGLSKALRNIYSSSITSLFLLVKTSGSRYKFDVLTSSVAHGSLLSELNALSDTKGKYNLYPLLSELGMVGELTAQLKKSNNEQPPHTYTLYISIKNNIDKVDNSVKAVFADTLQHPEQHVFFINNALNSGKFFAVQLKASRLKEADMEYLNPELAYIGSYAIHKAKQIEQEISSVVGAIELFDITTKVLTLHKFLDK